MSKIVMIFGAGASVCAGAPLMFNFLDVADVVAGRNRLNAEEQNAWERVCRGIVELQRTSYKASIELDNLESIFAAFEMGKLLGRLGSLDLDQVYRLPAAMRRTIESTLENTVSFFGRMDGNLRRTLFYAPEPYAQCAKIVNKLVSKYGSDSVSIVTFNYDPCLDFALANESVPFDYEFEMNGRRRLGGIQLLKLHGSMTWGRCDVCHEPVFIEYSRKTAKHMYIDGELACLKDVFTRRPKCCGSPVADTIIVPPTWSKASHHEAIQSVWKAAATALSDAEFIFVFGYSLPPSDQFFRFLYALGTIGEKWIKAFRVYDPSTLVAERFRSLLGGNMQSRFDSKPLEFDSRALGEMQHVLHEFSVPV